MEPEAVAARQLGKIAQRVHRPGVRRAGRGADGERQQPRRSIARDGLGHRRRLEAEALVGRQGNEGLGREAEDPERAPEREVRLVRHIDTNAFELAPPRRMTQLPQGAEVDIADDGEGHEVGHHAARGQEAEAALAVADELTQPADHLLLDQRARGPGMPHVDALVDDLGEDLARDRRPQRRRREVGEGAWVPRVELVGGETLAELGQQLVRRDPLEGRLSGLARWAEEAGPKLGMPGRLAHGAFERMLVEVVERGRPGGRTKRLESGPRRRGLPDVDESWLRMPRQVRPGHPIGGTLAVRRSRPRPPPTRPGRPAR